MRLPRLRQQLTKLPLLLSRWPNAKVVALVLVCCAAVLFVPQVAVAIYTLQPKVGFMGHSDKLQLSSNIMEFIDSLEVILHYIIYCKTSLERTLALKECPLKRVFLMFCSYSLQFNINFYLFI